MAKVINIIGERYGKLVVIKRIYPNRRGATMWLCKCDCGKEKIILGISLRRGLTKSCGCLRKELAKERDRLNPIYSSMRRAISTYKSGAKRRGIEYNLTKEQFVETTQKECHYCGAKPNNITKQRRRMDGKIYKYNGIDRVDNKRGYVIDNVVPCCIRCNRAKYIYTLQEYKDWIRKSYNKLVCSEKCWNENLKKEKELEKKIKGGKK